MRWVLTSHGIAQYREWLAPAFDQGLEDPDHLNDYSFDYGDYHFVVVDSGFGTDTSATLTLTGLTDPQLNWMKIDYNHYKDKMDLQGKTPHAFIFTHGPIVTPTCYLILDCSHESPHDYNFVKWLTMASSPGVPLPYIEAVFTGHTHNNEMYYNVRTTSSDPNDANIFYLPVIMPGKWLYSWNRIPNQENWYIAYIVSLKSQGDPAP
jgi:hypothetical protein